MASESAITFGKSPKKAMGDVSTAAAAVVDHLASPEGGFDTLADQSDPNQIEPIDLVRVALLGKPLHPSASRWLLSDEGRWLVAETLADIPVDLQLGAPHPTAAFRCGDLLALLREGAELGQAQATRLIAAKRPVLGAIDDKATRHALKTSRDQNCWRRWRAALDDDLLEKVEQVRLLAAESEPLAEELSALRIIDIAIRANASQD